MGCFRGYGTCSIGPDLIAIWSLTLLVATTVVDIPVEEHRPNSLLSTVVHGGHAADLPYIIVFGAPHCYGWDAHFLSGNGQGRARCGGPVPRAVTPTPYHGWITACHSTGSLQG